MEEKNLQIFSQNLRERVSLFLLDCSDIISDKSLSDSKKFRQIKQVILDFCFDYLRIFE